MKVIVVVTVVLGASVLLLTRNVAEARPTDVGSTIASTSAVVGTSLNANDLVSSILSLTDLANLNYMQNNCMCPSRCGTPSKSGDLGILQEIGKLVQSLLSSYSNKGLTIDGIQVGTLQVCVEALKAIGINVDTTGTLLDGCKKGMTCGSQQPGNGINVAVGA